MAKDIWIEYTDEDAELCIECTHSVILDNGFDVHVFCTLQCQENENGTCPKFNHI